MGSIPIRQTMSKSNNLVRVYLCRRDPETGALSYMDIYVDDRPDLKIGNQITLKDSEHPEWRWQITDIYEHVAREDIKQGWNNNI